MIVYADIYLKKQSTEYARILNVSDAVHSIRSQYKLLNGKFNPKMDTVRTFLFKIRTLFLIFKKSRGGFPSLPS